MKEKFIISNSSSFRSVLDKLNKVGLNSPVLFIENEKSQVIGSVSDGDIRRALIDNSNFSNLKANDLMNKNPLTAIETDNLQLAETRMREAKVQCLVVKNKIDEVVGVIQIFE